MAKKKEKSTKETPLMQQYNSIKAKHPDAVLLFRVGDFYETFGSDAVRAAKVLGIVLTKRKNGAAAHIELAGFPHHALDTYLPKLVRSGLRVAICDQLEDPKMTKTIVKRGITELVTPGVSYNEQILEQKQNNFLAAIHFGDKKEMGISFLDISTGEFLIAEGDQAYMDKLLQSLAPKEVLVNRSDAQKFAECFGDGHYLFYQDDWVFTLEFGTESLIKHFKTNSLKGFGIANLELGIVAAGACLQYLKQTQHHQVGHINSISRLEEEHFVWLDRFTIRNLELFAPSNSEGKSLLDVLDRTTSPMGSRMLRRWLAMPLKNKTAIDERLSVVDFFLKNSEITQHLEDFVNELGDLERLISKVAVKRITPRDTLVLQKALFAIEEIKNACVLADSDPLKKMGDLFHLCVEMRDRIGRTIHPEAPVFVNKGNVIQPGVNPELDELRNIAFNSKDHLQKLQKNEAELTGINSLKIGFNNVFGYYFEVRNTFKDKVPETWIRKQTLVNAERYITEELKNYETKILGAEEKIQAIETRLFNELVEYFQDYITPVQQNATQSAKLDCLINFARIAELNDYTKPQITDGLELNLSEGRHPVIEQVLPIGEQYISNSVFLENTDQQVIMITGPNMSGKSALLRQTALIVLMAQMGCYVPAKHAQIGVVDKVFTRVGASDNISMGESTFMVEMNETASILNNLSERSLILLDEIGRGTSTYDGISIAWAIAEYIHQSSFKPKTLFATHYHELNDMTNVFSRIKNFNVSIKEVKDKVIFLRKLQPGGTNHSFGIHVAQLAGMPRKVVGRAKEVLKKLESSHGENGESNSPIELQVSKNEDLQMSFFQLDDPTLLQIKEDILNLDINGLTPVEALIKLNEIKKLVGG